MQTERDHRNSAKQLAAWTARAAIAIAAATASGALAANVANNYTSTSSASLATPGNWSQGLPTVAQDATFIATSTNTGLTLSAASLTVGSLNDLHTGVTTTIQNDVGTTAASTFTFGGAGDLGNNTSGSASTDLVYVAGAATVLNLNGGATGALNFTLGQAGSFNTATATATLNIGATGVASTFNNGGNLLTFAGAGTTNIGSATAGVGATISGSGGITKTGTGTLSINGSQFYTGTTTVTGGTLAVGSDGALGSGGFVVSGQPTFRSTDATTRTLPNVVTFSGSSTVLTLGASTGSTGDIVFSSTGKNDLGALTRTFSVNNTTTFAGGFTGTAAGVISKEGPGTLILNGPSTFAGGISIIAGAGNVRLGNNTAAGSGVIAIHGVTTAAGTLQLAGDISVDNTVSLPDGRNDPAALGIAHIQNVSGNNTLTASTMTIASADTGVLFRSDAGMLTINSALTGPSSGTSARAYYLYGSGNGTLAGTITNGSGGSLTKTLIYKDGDGTWALGGANTYSGQTFIRDGTVIVTAGRVVSGSTLLSSSTGTGLTTVQAGGTLAGTGGTAAVTINDGGTISAGGGATALDRVGTLTTGNEIWNGGGTYAFKIASTAGSTVTASQTALAGTNWDRLVMPTLTVIASAKPFVIELLQYGSGLQFAPGAKFELATIIGGATFTAQNLADWFDINAAAVGLNDANFTLTTQPSTALEGLGGTDLMLAYTGPSVQSTPEPTAFVMVGVGAAALLKRRRRSGR